MTLVEIGSFATALIAVMTLVSKLVNLITAIHSLIKRIDQMQTDLHQTVDRQTQLSQDLADHDFQIDHIHFTLSQISQTMKEVADGVTQ